MSHYGNEQSPNQSFAYAPQNRGSTGTETGTPADPWTHGWFAVTDPGWVKGLFLGAAVTCALTNPKIQRALVKGAVGVWTAVQGGFEEVKEQFQDIKSEMSMRDNENE